MKKYLAILLLFAPLTLTTPSCEISPGCVTALCDLTTSIGLAAGATTIVPAGGVIQILNVVKNVKDVTIECETEIAVATNTLLNLKYKAFGSKGDYDIIFSDDNNPVPEIAPDLQSEEKYELTFNEPGDYIIVTKADNRQTASERDETNNEAPPFEGVGSKSTDVQNGIKITVLPNPDFKKKDGAPQVEVRRVSVEIKAQ